MWEIRSRPKRLSQAAEVRRVSYVTICWHVANLFWDVELLKMRRKREQRELVAFITVQTGQDLIVSFAVVQPDDPTDVESLTILRRPKYEVILEEWERGRRCHSSETWKTMRPCCCGRFFMLPTTSV